MTAANSLQTNLEGENPPSAVEIIGLLSTVHVCSKDKVVVRKRIAIVNQICLGHDRSSIQNNEVMKVAVEDFKPFKSQVDN